MKTLRKNDSDVKSRQTLKEDVGVKTEHKSRGEKWDVTQKHTFGLDSTNRVGQVI